MTRRRWIADEVHGNTAVLTGEHAAHLSRVLRAQIGQEFDIASAEGDHPIVRRGTITSISDSRVEFALGDELVVEPCANLTLILAIFKFDRMEWAIEKCAEIGVARIIPVVARHTDAHLASAAIKRHERWQRIARQAAEQSRRVSPPEIAPPVRLKDLGKLSVLPGSAGGVGTAATRIVLSESETGTRLRDVLDSSLSGTTSVTLAVGPEGGWTADELQWFRQNGWTAASLGDTILRAETAAIVAMALALDALR